jgi:hypothetical protein
MLADRAKLQEYADGCRAVRSPVRRLAPETLCEIFALYTPESLPEYSEPPCDDCDDGGDYCRHLHEEKSLSMSHMILLSQVCFQWRIVVLGTPKLWSDITVTSYDWPHDSTDSVDLINLLRTSLERGAHYPLNLSVTLLFMDYMGRPASSKDLLQLLVEHSDRWRDMFLQVHHQIPILDTIRQAKGRLGMLERLDLRFVDDSPEEPATGDLDLDIFEIAPALRHVRFANLDLPACPKLHWAQLRSFTYQYEPRQDVAAALALMYHLDAYPNVAFELRSLDAWGHNLSLNLPQITSLIISFLISPCTNRGPHDAIQFLGDVLRSLTLPHLREFYFDRELELFRNAILWPMQQFESLSMRSAFRDTLRTLELPHVIITEDELVRSLSSLDSLEHLVISDQLKTDSIPRNVLITNSFLLRLTTTPRSPESRLVPKLKYFGACTSFFNFEAEVYLNFIVSRIEPDGAQLHVVLRHFFGDPCELESDVLLALLALMRQGKLQFQLEEDKIHRSRTDL